MENFVEEIETMFYVSVKFHHNFELKTNSSKPVRYIHAEIMDEIRQKTHRIFKFFSFLGAFLSFFIGWILLR